MEEMRRWRGGASRSAPLCSLSSVCLPDLAALVEHTTDLLRFNVVNHNEHGVDTSKYSSSS